MKTRICCALLLVLSSLASSTALARPADACIRGYVWREAFPGDHVCVTPGVRAQAARDNRMAKRRIQRGGGAHGADTCIRGYVWREANRRDHVCVTPATRRQAAEDNRMAKRRIARSQPPMSATSPAAAPPPPTRAPAVTMIRCPVRSVRAEIITPLPDPWWQTPQEGQVMDTKVVNVGGHPTLMCVYQAYGRGVAVMRRMPPGVRDCRAIRNGFRCR